MEAFDDMLGGFDPTLSAVALSMTPQPQDDPPKKPKKDDPPKKPKKDDPPKKPNETTDDGPVKRRKKDDPPKKPKETITPKDDPPKTPKDDPPQKPKKSIMQTNEASRKLGDIWWCEELGRALRQMAAGPETSTEPREKDGTVVVEFADGLEWSPPGLIPSDLAKFGSHGEKLPNAAKKAAAKTPKPVQDYILETIRAKYKLQGKCSPIVSLECREDRFNLKSSWRQKCQIVVKDDMTAQIAMNIMATFCDCYQQMNMNQNELDFKVCRECFLEMHTKGMHDFDKGKMDWEKVSEDIKKAFPPKPT
ncbi:unnamed protein product, partial [Symbiodinium sp. CCMP2456]